VLELGCGTGQLWAENAEKISPSLKITLTDISPSLLEEASRNLSGLSLNIQSELVDATHIPYHAESYDVVVANHLLYHLADVDAALVGICRVLEPAGSFYASTVGLTNMSELQHFMDEAGWAVDLDLSSAAKVFGLENGTSILGRHFRHVDLLDYPDSLLVPTAEAVVKYLASFFPTQPIPDRLRKVLQDEIEERGVVHITKSLGMFCCSEPYLMRQSGSSKNRPYEDEDQSPS
jgi:SAM-dependent methyltransferase